MRLSVGVAQALANAMNGLITVLTEKARSAGVI